MNNFHALKIISSINIILAFSLLSPAYALLIPEAIIQNDKSAESRKLMAGIGEIVFEKYEPLPFESCVGMQKYFNSLFSKKTRKKIKFHDFENSKFTKDINNVSTNNPYYCTGYYTETTPLGTQVCEGYISAEPNGNDPKGSVFPDGSTSGPYRYAYTFKYYTSGKDYESCRWIK